MPGASALANPIFEREFVVFCRTRRWFAFRTALILLLTIFLWLVIGQLDYGLLGGDLDQVGRVLFGTFIFIQVGFVYFLTPALLADLVVGERRRRTLEVLLTTPLTPFAILSGKLLSRLAIVFVIVMASFPVVSISLLYGGVRGGQVLDLLFVTLGTTLFVAGPALLASTLARRSGTATVLAYLFPLIWCVVLPIVLAESFRSDSDFFAVMTRIHPFFAAAAVGLEEVYVVVGNSGISPALTFLGLGTAICTICLALSVVRLRRESSGMNRGASGEKNRVALLERRLRQLSAILADRYNTCPEPEPRAVLAGHSARVEACLADARRLRASEDAEETESREGRAALFQAIRELETALDVPDSADLSARTAQARRGGRRRLFRNMRNPVLWKEVHLVNASHSKALFYIAWGLLMLSEFLFFAISDEADLLNHPFSHMFLVCSHAFLLMILVVVNGATSVISEREAGTLELLRVTLLKPRDITGAKVLGTLRSVLFLAVIPIGHLVLACALGAVNGGSILAFAAALLVVLGYLSVSGVRFSITSARTSRATLKGMGLLGFLIIGIPLIVLMFGMAAGGGDGEAWEFFLAAHPFMLLGFLPTYATDPETWGDKMAVYCMIWLVLFAVLTVVRYLILPVTYDRFLKKEDR